MSEITKKKYYGDHTKDSPAETIVEYTPNDDDRIFELEKQLHEQYAINNNSNSAALISLMGALLVVMTGYGYVLYQYHLCPCRGVKMVYVTACIASLVMALLYCVCIHLGAGQRMEQFITFAIRAKYYGINENDERKQKTNIEIFNGTYPPDYNPFDKSINNFVQGLYNILSCVFAVAMYAIALILTIIVQNNLYNTTLFVLFTLSLHCLSYSYKIKRFVKYKKRESHYMKIFEYTKILREEKHTSIYEVQMGPKWLIVMILTILVLSILALVAFPYVDCFINN